MASAAEFSCGGQGRSWTFSRLNGIGKLLKTFSPERPEWLNLFSVNSHNWVYGFAFRFKVDDSIRVGGLLVAGRFPGD